MANHKSALKRAGQNARRRLRNRTVQTRVKNAVKDVRMAVSENAENCIERLRAAQSDIAKAAKKGVLHRKTASRKISRLTKLVNLRQV
ncbi:30S ribosomal protein S20 [Desulfosarcina sp. OttesenSCG-928-G10]|nr:30S ribosomal protein S20 [Desulfosarcina sp. OttesenSCG-928-G10]MDL2321059.1 30S ribosomal protein S20 [Desulfosarcina sp. OttesenSCG-928-B08]